ncbi:UNVERIFIED_ORG: hypothetical protein ABIC97_004128 [Peribacillus simplex]
MDLNSNKEAFSEFLTDKTLTANQIKFINLIIEYFAQKGKLHSKMLFQERPFINYHHEGVMRLFPAPMKRLRR